MSNQNALDVIADVLHYKRPFVWRGLFSDLELNVGHEGFMVLDSSEDTTVCKIKSNHYLSKKALMRMGKKQASIMYNNTPEFKKRLDEEFYSLLEYLTSTYTLGEYQSFKEQERRSIIEEYFNENCLHS